MIRSASNLPDTDPIWDDPDPYVQVKATKSDLQRTTRTTSVKSGTRNPTWNTWLTMSGCAFLNYLTVQVFDDDIFFDDEMSSVQKFNMLLALQACTLTLNSPEMETSAVQIHVRMEEIVMTDVPNTRVTAQACTEVTGVNTENEGSE
jgi:Ca2+-dependent lipid-binding protein